jgi:hypothetical protein
MAINKLIRTSVGADLSCPSPIYRPSPDGQPSAISVGADLSCPPPIYRPSPDGQPSAFNS